MLLPCGQPTVKLVHKMVQLILFLVVCYFRLGIAVLWRHSASNAVHISRLFRDSACFSSRAQSAKTSTQQRTACIDCHPAGYSLERLSHSIAQPAVTPIGKVQPAKPATQQGTACKDPYPELHRIPVMLFELRISTREHYVPYLLSGSAHRHAPTPALGPSAPAAAHRGSHTLCACWCCCCCCCSQGCSYSRCPICTPCVDTTCLPPGPLLTQQGPISRPFCRLTYPLL